MEKEKESRKVQVLRLKCCNKIYAGCVEPHCYTLKSWLKDLKEAVKEGDKIEMIPLKDFSLEDCTCKK